MPENLQAKLRLEVPTLAWLTEPLDEDVRAAVQRLARAPDVQRLAIMPDVHLAKDVCVGVALATRSLVYPQAVGGDIGCGISTVPLQASIDDVRNREELVLRILQRVVPILKHAAPSDVHVASAEALALTAPDSLATLARRDGMLEFATLGRGNHFLELQADEQQRLWLAVHSGSRGMGQRVFAHAAAESRRTSLWSLDTRTERGRAYMEEAHWCVRYAEASRLAMLHVAATSLQSELGFECARVEAFGTSHNFVERSADGSMIIHRKGVSPAYGGVPSIIPGSMGSRTYHVVGRGVDVSLYSSSHGAGRVMSRSEARQEISMHTARRELQGVTYEHKLGDALAEEAPSAYRDIRHVMRAQSDLVRIVRTLRTLVSHKGA